MNFSEAPLVGLLFDKDGTLVDFHATWGPATLMVARTLARGDHDAVERIAASLSLDLETVRLGPTSPMISASTADYAGLFARPVGLEPDAAFMARLDALFAEATRATLAPIGDPAKVLAGLKAGGFRLGLATDDSEAAAIGHVARLGLEPLLEFLAGYDSGHGRKPEPGMVAAFAERLGVPASRVAIIGDSRHDLEAGRAAGAVRIAVLTGPAGRDELAPYADLVIESIAALPALLPRPGRQ